MKRTDLAAVLGGFACCVMAQTLAAMATTPTQSSALDCDSAWGSLEANLPTPPPSLADAWNAAHIASNGQTTYFTDLAGICSFASAHIDDKDTSLGAAYSAFNLQYYAWYVASSEPWKALVTACPSTAAYGPIEQQTSELSGVLTAYSSFGVAGCSENASTATVATTKGMASSTPTPTLSTVNSGLQVERTVFSIIAAALNALFVF